MSQEDDRLTQIFAGQQRLAVKYQELDMLIMQHISLLQECDDEWTEKLAQDTSWRIAVDGKLQTILNLLGRSALQIGPLQTDTGGSYFGWCLSDYNPTVAFTE
jgi:hypothetical protein